MGYLKDYQEDCVDAVTAYLKRTRELGNPRLAFLEDESRGDYASPDNDLRGMPYVCLKVPTGGGKTAIAAFCVKPLLEVMGQRESGPVIWLAPTTKIVDQTVAALKDRAHPYRQELDRAFDGRVVICDVGAALYMTRDTIEHNCVILVTTFGAVRREDEDLLRVFRVNGALKHHFSDLTAEQREALLTRAGEGEDPIQPTLGNVLKMHRPVVVVDEAHNARTPLSYDTLKRFGPSCVLELTATPADDSNVLLSVSAARLKAEQMIKLPVMLRTRKHARDAMASAVEKRKELADLAAAERDTHGYVRPVVLYQAQSGDSEFNAEGVKRILIDELMIDPDRVAICTGSKDELPDEPIDSATNPVEHIITVQKLREGWDCPFAYILCSVASLGSKTAVEQILGRVLRMPYAMRRGDDELNRAYCYATSENFQEAATNLKDALVENCGFTHHEARRIVRPEPVASGGGTLYDDAPEPVSIELAGSIALEKLPDGTKEHVQVQPRKAGGTTLTWTGGPIISEQAAALNSALSEKQDSRSIKRLEKRSWSEDDSPSALGVPFSVPAMAVKEDGQWVLLDDQPAESPWSLADCNHKVDESEFRVAGSDSRVAKYDVNAKGDVTERFLDDLDRQIQLFDKSGRDTPAKLATWLGRHIREPAVTAADKHDFLLRMIEDLIDRRGLELGQLDRNRHRLKDAAAAKISAHRLHAEASEYQQLLSDDFGIDMSCRISFPPLYPADKLCEIDFNWEKHYYPEVASMNKPEIEVAKYIDGLLPVVHWVRNLDRSHHADHAFWLRRPHGRFFPDFVAELMDERYLVVEYKDAHEQDAEEQEKRRAGEMWQAAAPNEVAFVWATKNDWQDQIDAAVARLIGG